MCEKNGKVFQPRLEKELARRITKTLLKIRCTNTKKAEVFVELDGKERLSIGVMNVWHNRDSKL